MKKLFLILLILCSCLSLEAMHGTRSKKKKEDANSSPILSSRSKKRKLSDLTQYEEKEKNNLSEKNEKGHKGHNDSDSEDEAKSNLSPQALQLATLLQHLGETDGDGAMQNIAMMHDKHLTKYMQLKEKELVLKTKIISAALHKMNTSKNGITIGLDGMVVKVNGDDEPPQGMFG